MTTSTITAPPATEARSFAPAAPSSRPLLAMGLTFLLLGIGFAYPYPLVLHFPPGMWEGRISQQALNLYALTVFLGWGHFFYAFQGQYRASTRLSRGTAASYWLVVVFVLLLLLVVRGMIGVGTFSLIVWIYNIAHFIKAERFFAGGQRVRVYQAANFYMPVVAFAWFTLVLFHVGPIAQSKAVFLGSIAIAAIALLSGDWNALSRGEAKLPLLTFFLLGETMLWDAYNPTPAFAVGVYVVHVAAASFFHYLGGYFHAQRGESTPSSLRPAVVVLVNLISFTLGCAVDRVPALAPLRYVFAPEWFTVWVGLHLVSSDLLPVWKRSR